MDNVPTEKPTVRKEVSLTPTVIQSLQEKAKKKKWSLKRYMEVVLIANAEKGNKDTLKNPS